jgi:rubrerythrin
MNLNRTSVPKTLVVWCMVLLGLTAAQCFAGLTTVTVLNDAWNIENNAMRRSNAFAERADQEGHAGVASLFRAVAQSQRVHARNLAASLKKLGSQPVAVTQTFAVTSSDENLHAELAVHAGYVHQIFPAFLSALKREGFSFALRSIEDASRSEASYVSYMREAEHLDPALNAVKTIYYVCNQCGYMTQSRHFQVCKVCYHFRRQHEPVS